jgi:hypothetical protein
MRIPLPVSDFMPVFPFVVGMVFCISVEAGAFGFTGVAVDG